MAIEMRRLHPSLGVEILGVDARHVDGAAFAEIVHAFEEHSVLLFRGQSLSDAEQVAFSQRFGPLDRELRRPGHSEEPGLKGLGEAAVGEPPRERRAGLAGGRRSGKTLALPLIRGTFVPRGSSHDVVGHGRLTLDWQPTPNCSSDTGPENSPTREARRCPT